MKILFLGGTGFFGESFKSFIKKEKETNIAINYVGRSDKYFFKDSFINYNQIHKIKKKEYSHLIHCAHASTNRKNLTEVDRFNKSINTTLKLLKLCKKKNIDKFIYISSGIVYKDPNGKNDVNDKISSISSEKNYKNSKIICEKLVKNFCKKNKIKYIILRCFSFCGKMQKNKRYAIPNLISQFKKKNQSHIFIDGTGKDIRSFMHQEDLARSLLKIIKSKKKNTLYNIGSTEKISVKNLALKIKKIMKSKKKIIILKNKKNITKYAPKKNLTSDLWNTKFIRLDESLKEII